MLSDDPVYHCARRHHARSNRQGGHDLADSFRRDGGHGHDGDAALAGAGPQHEVELSARTAEHGAADLWHRDGNADCRFALPEEMISAVEKLISEE